MGTVSTNASGVYTKNGLPTGTYYVRTSNSLGYIDELYDNLPCAPSCTVTSGAGVSVTAGATTGGINFGLAVGGNITGAVIGCSDGRAAGRRLRLRLQHQWHLYGDVTTNASGVYTKTELATGTYYVRTSNSLGYIDELYNNMPRALAAALRTSGNRRERHGGGDDERDQLRAGGGRPCHGDGD